MCLFALGSVTLFSFGKYEMIWARIFFWQIWNYMCLHFLLANMKWYAFALSFGKNEMIFARIFFSQITMTREATIQINCSQASQDWQRRSVSSCLSIFMNLTLLSYTLLCSAQYLTLCSLTLFSQYFLLWSAQYPTLCSDLCSRRRHLLTAPFDSSLLTSLYRH